MPDVDSFMLLEQLNAAGHALWLRRNFETALAVFRRCAALEPDNSLYWANIGSTLWNMNRLEEARKMLRKALTLSPDSEIALINLAKVYASLNDPKADALYARALELNPQNNHAKLDRAFTRLEQGDWERGFADYEVRLTHFSERYQKMPGVPTWKGEDLNGKTLYVQGEQGIGDNILFSRYLYEVHKRYPTCTIKLCVDPLLLDLFWEARHFLSFLPTGIPFDTIGADYGIYMGSLLGLLGTRINSIPADPGFINARVEHSRATPAGRFNMPVPTIGDPLKVGLCWTGNPAMSENSRRSVPLAKLMEIAGDPEFLFCSLQFGAGREELVRMSAGEVICDLVEVMPPTRGFVPTAMAMKELDVVVTCCTSVAHLAGACNIPTILMLCSDPYWVWLRKSSKTDWYPTIDIVRQREPGQWDSVLDTVYSKLVRLQGARRSLAA